MWRCGNNQPLVKEERMPRSVRTSGLWLINQSGPRLPACFRLQRVFRLIWNEITAELNTLRVCPDLEQRPQHISTQVIASSSNQLWDNSRRCNGNTCTCNTTPQGWLKQSIKCDSLWFAKNFSFLFESVTGYKGSGMRTIGVFEPVLTHSSANMQMSSRYNLYHFHHFNVVC